MRKLGRQIFQTVHRQIDASLGHRLFDLFRKHSFRSHFGEGNVEDFISCRLDYLNRDGVSLLLEQRGDVIRLPESKLRAA